MAKRKTVITKSRIEYVDLAINPALGCSHACTYCYARMIDIRFKRVESVAEWHRPKTFENLLESLEKELEKRRIPPDKEIFISTMTDPYQEILVKTNTTRQIIELLKKHGETFRVLTKSDLITKDKDVLGYEKGLIGLSITTNKQNEEQRKHWEPRAPPISKRLQALKELSEYKDINLWVSAEPFLPKTDFEKYFEEIFQHSNGKLKELVVGKMNHVYKVDHLFNWGKVVRIIEAYAERHPETIFHYKQEFLHYLEERRLDPVSLGLIDAGDFAERQNKYFRHLKQRKEKTTNNNTIPMSLPII